MSFEQGLDDFIDFWFLGVEKIFALKEVYYIIHKVILVVKRGILLGLGYSATFWVFDSLHLGWRYGCHFPKLLLIKRFHHV